MKQTTVQLIKQFVRTKAQTLNFCFSLARPASSPPSSRFNHEGGEKIYQGHCRRFSFILVYVGSVPFHAGQVSSVGCCELFCWNRFPQFLWSLEKATGVRVQGLVKQSHKAALRLSHLGDDFSGIMNVIGLIFKKIKIKN